MMVCTEGVGWVWGVGAGWQNWYMRSNPGTDASDTTGVASGVDVSGLEFLPGLEGLPRCADGTVPALVLATFLDGLDVAELDSDAEVLDVAVGWNRLTAWTQARHYTAVAEFVRRPVIYPPPDPAVAKTLRRPVGGDRPGLRWWR